MVLEKKKACTYMFSGQGQPTLVIHILYRNKTFVSQANNCTLFPFNDFLKDLNSTVAKRGSVFIGLMTPDGAIWFRYQRVVPMR